MDQYPRSSAGRAIAVSLLVVFNSACAGAMMDQAKPDKSGAALNFKAMKQADGSLLFQYQPRLESAMKMPGANFTSDGKVLRVDLPRCPVTADCPVQSKAQVKLTAGKPDLYQVVIPYRGERVVVRGMDSDVEVLVTAQ
jgi:hypothetical protein